MFGTDGEDDELNISSPGADDGDDEEDLEKDPEGEEEEDRGDDVDDTAALEKIAGDDDDGEGKPKGKSETVPYRRFSEVVDSRRKLAEALETEREQRIRLEERLKANERAPAKEPEKKIDLEALEEEYASKVLEGDAKAAREIRAQIRAAEAAEAEERVLKRVREENAAAAEKAEFTRFQNTAAQIVSKYPELDPKSDKVNKEAIEDVRMFRDAFIAKGHSLSDALKLATQRAVKLHDLGKAKEPEPKPEPKTDPKDQRRAAIIDRNAKAERQVPPRPRATAGGGDLDIDPEQMDDSDFAKLPEAEKRRLRGDTVT